MTYLVRKSNEILTPTEVTPQAWISAVPAVFWFIESKKILGYRIFNTVQQ